MTNTWLVLHWPGKTRQARCQPRQAAFPGKYNLLMNIFVQVTTSEVSI